MTLPSLENLRCFLAGAQALNFRAAAKAVHLTPAAYGARIQQLEEQLGVRLFARTTRHVALTEGGHALVAHAAQVVALAAETSRAVRGELAAAPVELTLGTRHELGMSWLLPQLGALRKALPHVWIHLYFGSGEDLLLRVRTHEVDAAVTSSRTVDPKLDAIPLHPEAYVFVAARRLVAGTPLRRRAQAAQHTLLDAAPDLPLYRYWRDAAGADGGLSFARVWILGTLDAIVAMVRAGRGVAVLPRYVVDGDLGRGTLVELFPKVRPADDVFRLVFRAGDARRGLFERIAVQLLRAPLA